MIKTETTIGRRKPEDMDDLIKNPFLNDYTKIVQSRAYRRLASKTQFLSFPTNPHVRSRLTHTNEVAAVSLAISENLELNNYLCMAIAAGHDIGHTPYGHTGEETLTEISGNKFRHNIFSVVVAQHIERTSEGLNLTHETLEGMLKHSRANNSLAPIKDEPQEFNVIMYSDKIASIISDVNDAVRFGYLEDDKLPSFITKLGNNQHQRTKKCIEALIEESTCKDYVSFSEGHVYEDFKNTRDFMYDEVYAKHNNDIQKDELKRIYEYFSREEEFKGVDPIILTALLSDIEVESLVNHIKSGRKTKPIDDEYSVSEISAYLKHFAKSIDYTDPDLNWP